MSKKLRITILLFYPSTLLFFIYLKIARVHKKEEKLTALIILQHVLVALSAIGVYVYGFTNLSWYIVLLTSFVFYVMAALLVTVVQLGIFIDGKPQFGISAIYKYLPVVTLSIIALSAIIWL